MIDWYAGLADDCVFWIISASADNNTLLELNYFLNKYNYFVHFINNH